MKSRKTTLSCCEDSLEHSEAYRHIEEDRQIRHPKKLDTWAEAFVSLRDSVGFKTKILRYNLRMLISFMREHSIESFDALDRMSAARWLHSGSPQEITIIVRLAFMRGFFRYLLGLGAVKENVWESFTNPRPKLFLPRIFTADELKAILEKIYSKIAPRLPIRSHIQSAYYTIYHTIYACGLRTCEVCGLDIGDMDLDRSLFVVRNSKFYKSRLVPFNSRTRELVANYLNHYRPADDGMKPDAPLFLNRMRSRFSVKTVSEYFTKTCREAGVYQPKAIKGNTVCGGTTTHSLRHSFAVHRLIRWYEEGADVTAKLPLLATYMGHTHFHNTQKYLTVLPTILDMAGKRFSETFEKPLKDLEWPSECLDPARRVSQDVPSTRPL